MPRTVLGTVRTTWLIAAAAVLLTATACQPDPPTELAATRRTTSGTTAGRKSTPRRTTTTLPATTTTAATPTTEAPTASEGTTSTTSTTSTSTTSTSTSTTTSTTSSTTTTTTAAPAGWTLYWSDEFNGTAVNTSRWKPYANNYGAGNNEMQCNLPANASVSGGSLRITGKRETVSCPGAGTYDYTSAFLGSRDTGTYYPLYGRFEIRARVPHGQGLWPGFWLRHRLGSSTAEVDVVELFHNQVPGKVTQTLHFPKSVGYSVSKRSSFFETPPATTTGTWHTFGVEIEPAGTDDIRFTFLVDGTAVNTYTNTDAGSWIDAVDKQAAWDMAVNMSIGGKWVGHPEQNLGYLPDVNLCGLSYKAPTAGPGSCPTTGIQLAKLSALYEVDWVRVYTR